MSSLDEQIARLEVAIAAQEANRPSLGDAVVDVTINALRSQLEVLRRQKLAEEQSQENEETLAASQVTLERVQSFLPKELAAKMRATNRIEGERKFVTVLFADIVGFTSLSERLDPEQVTTLTNEALRALAEAVYQYEGYIDKFMGDAVMAIFGAPIAHEDDTERGLRAALAMRERWEHFNHRLAGQLDQPLELHIGINSGLVVAGTMGPDLRLSYTVMGDTVNIASRLQAAAPPGKIYVGRDTYRVTQEAFAYDTLAPIQVKGKHEPLPVYELKRAKLHPRKARGLKELASSFVGRERELGQLRRVLSNLEAGMGHIVTIVGEAGIGKSRLMTEFQREVGDRVGWGEGRAYEHTKALAYAPFLDLFRHYAEIKDEDSELAARAHLNAVVTLLFGEDPEAQALFANLLGMALSEGEATLIALLPRVTLRQKLYDLIEHAFENLAKEQPVFLVIEDAHWADSASLELIEHLLPLTERVPLGIVMVFRPSVGEPLSKLQSNIQARYAERTTLIELTALSETSTIDMIQQLLSTAQLPPRLKTMILGKTEGNPFFVEELIRTLIDRGALVQTNGTDWIVTSAMEITAVPATLQGLLVARLDHLPNETKWVAQQASVIGRVFPYRVVLEICESDVAIDADLRHLEREELIRERVRDPELEFIFKHALIRDVAYQSLLAPRRKALHYKVGTAMENLFAERLSEYYSVIGDHFQHGEAWERALSYQIRAGDAAAGLYAHAEASQHYAAALEALAHLPDNDQNRRNRIDTTIKLISTSVVAEALEKQLERLSEAEGLVKGFSESGQMLPEDRLRLARIYSWKGRIHYYKMAPREAIGYYSQVLALAQDLGDQELLAIPSSTVGIASIMQGQFARAIPLLEQSLSPLEKTGNWSDWCRTTVYLGLARAAQGHYLAGVAEGKRAIARASEMNNRTSVGLCQGVMALIYLMGEDIQQMLQASGVMIEVAEQTGDRLYSYCGLGFRAWAETRLGKHEAAAESMRQSKVFGQSLGTQLVAADWLAVASAEIALNAGRAEEALVLAEQAMGVAKKAGSSFSQGLVERVWGQSLLKLETHKVDEAESHLTKSLELLESANGWLDAARTHIAWGELCQMRGDVAGARGHFEKALSQFVKSGLSDRAARTSELLQQLR